MSMCQTTAILCVVAALLTSCWRTHVFAFSTTRHPVGVLSSYIPDHSFLSNRNVATPPCCLGRLSGSVPRRPHCASSSKEDLGDLSDQKKPRLTAEDRLTDKDRERLLNSVDWVRKEVLSTRESQNAKEKEIFEVIVSHLNGKITLEELLNRLREVETSETGVEPLVEEKGGAGNEQPQGQNDEPPLSAREFLLLVKDKLTKFKDWHVIVKGETCDGFAYTIEKLQQLIESSDVNSIEEITVVQQKKNVAGFEKPFTEKKLSMSFLSDNRLKQVTEFLASTVKKALNNKGHEHGLVIPVLQYGVVQTEGTLRDHLLVEPQTDKDYAIVVAGESGSGKTVHSCQIPAAEGFCCLYAAIQGDDLKPKVKPDENTRAWGNHLQHIIDDIGAAHADYKSLDTPNLYDLKTLFNRQRNEWACNVFENVIRKALGGNSGWWDDGSDYKYDDKPDKLAIIIDEATDMDLANGLIDSIRDIYAEKRSLIRKSLRVILCGTGLDAVKRGGNVGTNPSKSKVVIMKAFNPENIGKSQNSVVLNAIAEGRLSKVLGTNTRMFFRGVYPLMSIEAHEVDGCFDGEEKKRRFESRLKEIGSFGALMDYSVRTYLVSNSLSTVETDEKKALLDASFLYHLTSSVQSSLNIDERPRFDFFPQPLLTRHPELSGRFWKIENGMVTTDDEIFSRGFAMRDGSTSTALRYLSCAGLSCRVETGDGNAFEDLVRLHLTRFYSILGYTVITRDLSNAWPPKSGKGSNDIGEEEIKVLADDLSKNSEKGLQKDVLLKEMKETRDASSEKWCVICRQGATTAQGADLLVLRCDGRNGAIRVDAIQAKHRASVPRASECWRSLGINVTTLDGEPEIGSAGYSYQGLMSFVALLGRQGFDTATLGKRVLAVSQVAGETGNVDISGKVAGTALWTREFLEPTFSCLEPNIGIARE